MLLIKNGILYIIKNKSENYNMEGRVFFENELMIINVLAYLNNGNYIGACSYKYYKGGLCSKVISDCDHQYVESLEQMMELIFDFLILRFNLS